MDLPRTRYCVYQENHGTNDANKLQMVTFNILLSATKAHHSELIDTTIYILMATAAYCTACLRTMRRQLLRNLNVIVHFKLNIDFHMN